MQIQIKKWNKKNAHNYVCVVVSGSDSKDFFHDVGFSFGEGCARSMPRNVRSEFSDWMVVTMDFSLEVVRST